MNATERAQERRLDAFLGAAVGADVPNDLAARIELRVRTAPPRRTHWLAAAVILGGTAVVVGVGLLHERAPTKVAQEPLAKAPSVAIATAAVGIVARPMVDVAAGADVQAELLRIAELAHAQVLLVGTFAGQAKTAMTAQPWRAAIAQLARDAGGCVRELGPLLLLTPGADGLPYDKPLTLTTPELDLRAFAKTFAAKAGITLVLDESLRGPARCELDNASWRDALDLLAKMHGGEVEGCGTALVLRSKPAQPERAPRTSFQMNGMPMQLVIERQARIAGLDVVVDARVTGGPVTVRAAGVAWATMLDAIAMGVGAEVQGLTTSGAQRPPIQRLTPSTTAATLLPAAWSAEDVDLRTFAELVQSATQTKVAVPDGDKARLSAFAMGRTSVQDLARAAAAATGHRLTIDEDGALRIE